MDNNWTDAQIIEEAHKIMADKRLRRCELCSHYDYEAAYCNKLAKAYPRYQYAGMCKHYETNEEKILRETREAQERRRKEEGKNNFVLTMTINSIEVALLFLEDFACRLENEFKRADAKGLADAKAHKNEKDWLAQLRRAYKQMQTLMEGVRRQYVHYVEPNLNKIFLDGETNQYDAVSYDDHMADAHELAKLLLLYFDKAYMNKDNADGVFTMLESLEGCGVMEDKDFKRYDFRR